MGTLISWLITAVILCHGLRLAACEKAVCRSLPVGSYGRSFRRDPLLKCHLFTNKTTCLSRFGQGYNTDNESIAQLSRSSCAWHHMQTNHLVETIRIHSWGTNAIQGKDARGPGQLNFRGSLCQLRLTAILPENSINKYGTYLSLQGGPYMAGEGSGFATDMGDQRRETISLGCTILPGDTKRNCTVTLTPPAGYALDQRFVKNSLYVDLFTVDPVRISQLRSTTELTPNQRMYVDLVHEWKRCIPPPAAPVAAAIKTPPATTTQPPSSKEVVANPQNEENNNAEIAGRELAVDKVVFGPTEYSLLYNPDQKDAYFVVDYRTYFIKEVTGVDYEVVVDKKQIKSWDGGKTKTKTSSKNPNKQTPLTVFFAKEPKDFYLGIDCDHDKTNLKGTTCIPPARFKLNGTSVCVGFKCTGKVRGLDPKQQYFLWVSYPRYLDPSDYDLTASTRRMHIPYTAEMVSVNILANNWKLGKVQTPKPAQERAKPNK